MERILRGRMSAKWIHFVLGQGWEERMREPELICRNTHNRKCSVGGRNCIQSRDIQTKPLNCYVTNFTFIVGLNTSWLLWGGRKTRIKYSIVLHGGNKRDDTFIKHWFYCLFVIKTKVMSLELLIMKLAIIY